MASPVILVRRLLDCQAPGFAASVAGVGFVASGVAGAESAGTGVTDAGLAASGVAGTGSVGTGVAGAGIAGAGVAVGFVVSGVGVVVVLLSDGRATMPGAGTTVPGCIIIAPPETAPQQFGMGLQQEGAITGAKVEQQE